MDPELRELYNITVDRIEKARLMHQFWGLESP